MTRSIIAGTGAYLPEKILHNNDLAQMVATSDKWIRQRTGIEMRHIADDGQTTSDLAYIAAKRALADAAISADAIDLIIVATSTPENIFPATATRLQAKLGITKGFAYDIQAVCSGFIFAMAQADNAIRLGQAKCVLITGAEIFSRLLDWQDRSTCVLFGDGAGAVILQAQNVEDDANGLPKKGILSTHLFADGRHYDQLYVETDAIGHSTSGFIRMNGREVFRFAINMMVQSIEAGLDASGLEAKAIDWLVPHQANLRIINAVGEKLGLSEDKVVITVQEHANTSAATIPIALARAAEQGKFKHGQLLALTAMGAGFTWGSAFLRW